MTRCMKASKPFAVQSYQWLQNIFLSNTDPKTTVCCNLNTHQYNYEDFIFFLFDVIFSFFFDCLPLLSFKFNNNVLKGLIKCSDYDLDSDKHIVYLFYTDYYWHYIHTAVRLKFRFPCSKLKIKSAPPTGATYSLQSEIWQKEASGWCVWAQRSDLDPVRSKLLWPSELSQFKLPSAA